MQLVCFERREGEHAFERPGDAPRPASFGDAAFGFEALAPVRHGARRLGAILPAGPHAGSIVDLNRALAIRLAGDDVGAPEAEADSLLPSDMLVFLRRGAPALAEARAALEFAADATLRYDAPDLLRAGVIHARRRVKLCAPVPHPGKVVAVARNYLAHARERGAEAAPGEPVLFLKASSAVIGPDDEIRLPEASRRVDFEGELAVVIGSVARELTADAALACVAGYTVANDVSARDFQGERGQHFIGKSCDTFLPLGPALVSADEIPDPQDLGLRTIVSGDTMQSARTKEMIFPVAEILVFASRLMTLEPGDVLLTGTPAGVGAGRTPPRWLRDGDVVEIEIERLGRLRNYVRAAPRVGAGGGSGT
jgi:2-keto-4-pentenoate hydratase/2-oxohepta-3-ene-1,7-dioic acid hydratase in catechol pathway